MDDRPNGLVNNSLKYADISSAGRNAGGLFIF